MSHSVMNSVWNDSFGSRVLLAALFAASASGAFSSALLAQAPPAAPAVARPAGTPTNTAPSAMDERGYKTLVVYERMLKEKSFELTIKGNVRKVIQGTFSLSDQRRTFDAYYQLYYFPLMTQTTDAALQNLPDERMKFLRFDLELCRNIEVQKHLTTITFDEMLAITRDPEFHPAVRYNALSIIGSLNDKEVVRLGGSPSVPEPMARALPVLLEEFRRAENSDALKVAALIGISRHLEWDPYRDGSPPIPAALRTEITNELIALAEAKEAPAGRTAEGHLWLRRRAIEALGLACAVKTDATVAAALDKLLKDDSETVSLRAAVAAAVGRMKYDAPVKVDSVATAKELGYLALVACDRELNRVADLRKTETERESRIAKGVVTFTPGEAGGGGTGGASLDSASAGAFVPDAAPAGMGGMGRGAGAAAVDPKAYRFDHVRRRLRYQLYCVQLGLNGGVEKTANQSPTRGMMAIAKAPPEIQAITDIDKNVRSLIETIEVKATDMGQLEKDLRKTMTVLEGLTKKLAAPAAAAVPSDVPMGDLPAAPPAVAPADEEPAAAPGDSDLPADVPAATAPPAAAPPAAAPPADAPPAVEAAP